MNPRLCVQACHLQYYAVTVEAVITPQVTSTTANQTTLFCSMRDYIRPDEQFQWFRENEQLFPELSDKYSAAYVDGSPLSQKGLAVRSPARLTVLFVENPNVGDAGLYTCAVNETFATVELLVNDPFGRYSS